MMYTYLGMYMAGVDLFCKRGELIVMINHIPTGIDAHPSRAAQTFGAAPKDNHQNLYKVLYIHVYIH